mgnify:CR=1 FL=1
MTPKTLPINEIQEIFDMKQLKKIAAAVLIAAMLGLLLPQLGVNAEALKRGSRGDLVRQLQTRLRSWGYYSGTVDGVYGAKTESAVRAFQKRNGLTADGIVGQKTAAALGLNLPSSTGGGSAASSNGNLYLLARLVHGEARGEPYKGKVAVAAVVLNRVRSASFPNTIAGVIYQSGAFDAVSDGQINLAPDDYYQMLLSILEAYILPQEGEIYFSVKDLENMPVGFGKEIEEIALAKGGKLTVAGAGRDNIDNGFILAYGGIEENCTIRAMFDAKRDELSDIVHRLLFV